MTRRDFDPSELGGQPVDPGAADELQRYAQMADGQASSSFVDRVMASVEQSPPPGRGIFGWLRLPAGGAMRGLAQAAVLAGALALTAGGVLAAGELARWLRGSNLGGSPSPAPSESFVPSPSASPESSASQDPASPPESEDEPSGSVPASGSAPPSQAGSASAAQSGSAAPSGTPLASGSPDDNETATPRQSETPEPTPSPTPG